MACRWAADRRLIDAEPTRDASTTRSPSSKASRAQAARRSASAALYPVTLERVALWAGTLDSKGIALAPASALAELPANRPETSGAP